MAINTSRAPRRTSDFFGGKSQTSEGVAPGSYSNTHNEPAAVPGETAVPFDSHRFPKVMNPNDTTSNLTPGPGAYLGPREADEPVSPTVGHTSMKSKIPRMGPTAPGSSAYQSSTIVDNPGPGEYKVAAAEWTPRLRKHLRCPVKPVLEVQDKTMPSIPPQRLRPDDKAGENDDISSVRMRHTGDGGDNPGPGEYDVKGQHITNSSIPQTTFHASSLERKLWEPTAAIDNKLPHPDNPGPGTYEATISFADKAGGGDEDGEAQNTYQFSSNSQLAYQTRTSEAKAVPGPGCYEVDQHSIETMAKRDKALGSARGDLARFGAAVDRVGWSRAINMPYADAYNIRHVPGPGHYPDAPSSFPKDPKSKEAEKALPNSHKKKLHGVHHPAIVMALQDIQGPLQAFNSTDDRPCNKPIHQETPSPWQYNVDEMIGSSMASTLRDRAKVGRKGAFGCCADRFFGSPMAAKLGLPDPNYVHSESSAANQDVRHMFESRTPRFVDGGFSKVPGVTRVGNLETPAPGDYVVEREPRYNSPFRQPRREHLSFGSAKERFQEDVFMGHQANALNPGPGDYDGRHPGRKVRGCAQLRESRKPPFVGCTTEAVGPGSYGAMQNTMLKKTFNVSTQAPAARARSMDARSS